jgi:sporulation protein YlmC with PRC-barrel domain
MRKFSLLLSIMVLAALVLAACGAEETQTTTAVPGTDVPTETTEEATATEAPVGTETVMPDGTTTAGIPVTGENDPSRLSNQLNFDVWNQDGEQIGEVNDMILDLDNTRVSYVIVGTGGFLEIGEKDVLVPWNQLTVQTAGEGAVDENAFVLNADQALFENAPDVDLNTILPARGQPAADWDVDIRTYWESGVVPATEAPEATEEATASPEAAATETISPEATALPEGTAVGGVTELQGVVLASEVLGSAVTLSSGEVAGAGTGADATATVDPNAATATVDPAATAGPVTVEDGFTGMIEDLIVDIDTGDIRYVVVNTTLDEGERFLPIPLSFFQWDAANDAFAINADPAMIQEAPFFEDGVWPDMSVDTWDDEFEAFWQ